MTLEEINPENLKKVSDKELQMVWLRLHQWFTRAVDSGRSTENIINAAVWVREEMDRRGIQYNEESPLLKQASDIVLVPDFVCMVGSIVDSDNPEDLDILIRAKRDIDDNYLIEGQNIRLPVRNSLGLKDKPVHWLDSPQGPHSDYIPLYSLVLRPEKPEKKVIKADYTPFHFIPPKPKMAGYTEAYDIEELVKWAKQYNYKLAIEPKYNGFRAIFMREKGELKLFFEGSMDKNRIEQFKELTEGVPDCDFVFDGELAITRLGKREPRVELLRLNSNNLTLDEGEEILLTIFDIVYYDGVELYKEPFENRRKFLETVPFRNKYITLSQVKWCSDSVDIRNAVKWAFNFDWSEGCVAKPYISTYSLSGEALDWFKLKKVVEIKVKVLEKHKVENGFNYTCGVLKGDSNYTNTDGEYVVLGKTMNTSIEAEVGDILTCSMLELISNGELVWQNATVVDIDKDRKEPYYAKQCVEVAKASKTLQQKIKKYIPMELKDITYIFSEPTGAEILRQEPLVGPVAKVLKEEYSLPTRHTGIIYLSQCPEFTEVRNSYPNCQFIGFGQVLKDLGLDLVFPYPINDKHYLSAIKKEVSRKRERILKASDEGEEPSAEYWEENWYRLYPKSGKGRFVYQHHWRGLSEEEINLSEEELIKTNHSVHGDFRAEDGEGLWGFTLFEGSTKELKDYPEYSRLFGLKPDEAIQGSFKLEQPKQWLKVGVNEPFVAEPFEAGATSKSYAKFFAKDWGTYEIGVWREHNLEIFLNGKYLKGRYLISYAPVGGRRIWEIRKPEDQTPIAEKEEKEELVKEIKQKGQKYLIWHNPNKNKPPELINTEEIRKVSVKKADIEKRLVYGVVLEPNTPDAQGDIVPEEEIEKAAHRYLVESRVVGIGHSQVAKAEVVESYIAPLDFSVGYNIIKKGSWVLVTHILDDKLWEDIKNGTITGYSLGGWGDRIAL